MDFIDEQSIDKSYALLKDLTIIIPTYNRNYYLSRCLWYHSHFPFGEIIVADSSPEGKKIINREVVKRIIRKRGSNILYREYPPETDKFGEDIQKKWGDAAQQVKTEYSLFCTDKEFTNPKILCRCIDFLNKHDDYDVAAGPLYNIKKPKSDNVKIFEAIPGRSLSINYPDPFSRLLAFSVSKPDTYNISSIRRTQNLKYIYDRLFNAGIFDLRFGELGLELLTVLTSKSKFFSDEPQIYRDIIQLSSYPRLKHSSPESSASRYPLFDEYIKSGIYQINLDRLSSCVAQELLLFDSSEIPLQDLNELIILVIKNFQNVRGFFGNPYSQVFAVGLFIFASFPLTIQLFIRRLLNRPPQTPVIKLPKEAQIIVQIINKTIHLHKNDDVIPLD
nr:TIGR00180 family glycosyltransferase [uncultured Methanospirillum sp.]